MLNVPDDPLVIARARKGDMHAMETLYRMYETPVYNLGRRILTRPEEAEEVLQETFLEVFRNLGRYRGDGSISVWIRKIAASKALMRIRSREGRREEPLVDEGEGLPTQENDSLALKPGAILDRLRLEAALSKLPEPVRAVVWLHDVEGFTHDEIAQMTRKTPSHSKSLLARAHARLRCLLSAENEDSPCIRQANNS